MLVRTKRHRSDFKNQINSFYTKDIRMVRTNPFEAEKYKKHALEAAKDLHHYISKWDAYSGTENAKQLRIQLRRFLKSQARS